MPIRFQVDGDFYDHPKTTNMSDAAFSLWVRAGSFSTHKLTDGFVSEDVLVYTLRSSTDVADELVRRRLWHKVRGGYRFHEWDDRNLTKSRVEADRRADRERKKAHRTTNEGSATKPRRVEVSGTHSAGSNGNQQIEAGFVRPESDRNPDGIPEESVRIPGASVSVSVSVSESVSGSGHAVSPPPSRCADHIDNPDPPPCGRCAEARKNRTRWDMAEASRLADRDRTAPRCRKHRGQLANNCGMCRSELLAAEPDALNEPTRQLKIVPIGATA